MVRHPPPLPTGPLRNLLAGTRTTLRMLARARPPPNQGPLRVHARPCSRGGERGGGGGETAPTRDRQPEAGARPGPGRTRAGVLPSPSPSCGLGPRKEARPSTLAPSITHPRPPFPPLPAPPHSALRAGADQTAAVGAKKKIN